MSFMKSLSFSVLKLDIVHVVVEDLLNEIGVFELHGRGCADKKSRPNTFVLYVAFDKSHHDRAAPPPTLSSEFHFKTNLKRGQTGSRCTRITLVKSCFSMYSLSSQHSTVLQTWNYPMWEAFRVIHSQKILSCRMQSRSCWLRESCRWYKSAERKWNAL